MSNKCPNCGYVYSKNDAYCAMCGTKLSAFFETDVDIDKNILESDDISENRNIETKLNETEIRFDALAENASTNSSIIDSGLVNFVAVMLIICLAIATALFFIIRQQDNTKSRLRFNSMISNPASIPELKEPTSFLDLKTNLKSNEYFLLLYLKYSSDTDEKKEQVFISYLKEMDKLSHITNENMLNDDLDKCSTIDGISKAKKCAAKFSSDFKNVGVSAYYDRNTIYLYPNYKFIYKKYGKYLSSDMTKYLQLKAKYNVPINVGLTLNVKPIKIADKIYDFEQLYSKVRDVYIRDEILKTIYKDFRTFIFSPTIYATTTQEMKKEFKTAYLYFINMRRGSLLRPVVMSYLDKMRSYTDENFKKDYPYEMSENTFEDNVENSSLGDIFVQLRKSLFSDNTLMSFTYIYNIAASSWKIYKQDAQLSPGEYVFAAADANNNISIFNNTFSLVQELNIPKYTKLFISNNMLYAYNADKLSFYKVNFNGRTFNLHQLSLSDVTSIFPGINIINIDSFRDYNIYVEKDNLKANFIILSRYSQGYNGYELSTISGQASALGLPNMFSVSGYEDTVLSFHRSDVSPTETSDNAPTFKIQVRTTGYKNESDDGVVKYDEKTAKESEEDNSDVHNPVFMPKILKENDDTKQDDEKNIDIAAPPLQQIEPPND